MAKQYTEKFSLKSVNAYPPDKLVGPLTLDVSSILVLI